MPACVRVLVHPANIQISSTCAFALMFAAPNSRAEAIKLTQICCYFMIKIYCMYLEQETDSCVQ